MKKLLLIPLTIIPIIVGTSTIQLRIVESEQQILNQSDRLLIAKIICHEACNDLSGCQVAEVIFNRVNLGSKKGFKDSIKEVCYQKNQFSGCKSWPPGCDKCLIRVDSAFHFKMLPEKLTHYRSEYDKSLEFIKRVKVDTIVGGHRFGIYQ